MGHLAIPAVKLGDWKALRLAGRPSAACRNLKVTENAALQHFHDGYRLIESGFGAILAGLFLQASESNVLPILGKAHKAVADPNKAGAM